MGKCNYSEPFLTPPAVSKLINKWAMKPKWTEMHFARN